MTAESAIAFNIDSTAEDPKKGSSSVSIPWIVHVVLVGGGPAQQAVHRKLIAKESTMNRNRSKIALAFVLAVVCVVSAGAAAADGKDQSNAALAFDKLKSLVGQWEGTTDKGKVTTTYELVAGGSALLERVNMDGHGEMPTVYYLDGNRLMLTHYCIAGNQPNLQAERFDPASNELRFRFVNATNLASANAGHMHNAVLKLGGPDQFTADWTWYENGKEGSHVVVQNHRVR
jgi:hypothetical protein